MYVKKIRSNGKCNEVRQLIGCVKTLLLRATSLKLHVPQSLWYLASDLTAVKAEKVCNHFHRLSAFPVRHVTGRINFRSK